MCTVSAIALSEGGFRLACNRDELNIRPTAQPPVLRTCGQRRAIFPVDPVSDGTWIAVNDAGLALALLNYNPRQKLDAHELARRQSRGCVIPSLLHCSDVAEGIEYTRKIDPTRLPQFRLVIVDGNDWAEVVSNGWELSRTGGPFDGVPLLFTSSGLGDELVEHPRRQLFDRMIRTADACPQRQDAFHAHQWPQRPHLSVMMHRADARTVSKTVVNVGQDIARLVYIANGQSHDVQLHLRQPQLL
jgi:hypothetical protein